MILSTLHRLGAVVSTCAALLAAPLAADTAEPVGARLLDLLRLQETVEIMREEGMAYAEVLAQDMLPGPAGQSWSDAVERIYDAARMEDTVRIGFAETYGRQDVTTTPLEAFFASDPGRDIIGLEISARRAMTDATIEESARAAYQRARIDGGDQDARLAELDRMILSNDLIEANVVGGMNSSVRFYQGLADGGAIPLTEGDILAQVWGSEDETRSDTTEWLYAYLLLAYGPVEDADLAAYIDVLESREGQAMNTALFAGFDTMFSDISYALGRALAQEMLVEEL